MTIDKGRQSMDHHKSQRDVGESDAPGAEHVRHSIAYAPQGHFAGWPANNGLWAWDDGEILVGCSVGAFQAQKGHSVSGDIRSVLLRSLDGGETWAAHEPDGYLNDPRPLTDLQAPADLGADGFAMRVIGLGYHGTDEPRGGFYLSPDRGHTWHGPYGFAGLADHDSLRGLEMTPRTDYLVRDSASCTLFLSARRPGSFGGDRVFCARTTDGGQTFSFVSWMVPPSDPYRAVMPSTVRCTPPGAEPGKLVSAVRRRDMRSRTPRWQAWIDAYSSTDNGSSWSLLSRIGETGGWNGNPPALARLRDGRLCCVYGNRSRRAMLARFSVDEGETWEREWTLRDDFESVDDEPDFGYPRLVQRTDGSLLALYYWARKHQPQQHIAATIWTPPTFSEACRCGAPD
jgi:hypothetical protein